MPPSSNRNHIAEPEGNSGGVQFVDHATPSDEISVPRERETVAVTSGYGRYVSQGMSFNPHLAC